MELYVKQNIIIIAKDRIVKYTKKTYILIQDTQEVEA